MYEKPRVNVKVEPHRLLFIYARKASKILRPYARKNYATVEIRLFSFLFNKLMVPCSLKAAIITVALSLGSRISLRNNLKYSRY